MFIFVLLVSYPITSCSWLCEVLFSPSYSLVQSPLFVSPFLIWWFDVSLSYWMWCELFHFFSYLIAYFCHVDIEMTEYVNFFSSLNRNGKHCQEQKVRCLVHFFERICLRMPTGYVSFERKVLPRESSDHGVTYPTSANWSTSTVPLCSFEVKLCCASEFLHQQSMLIYNVHLKFSSYLFLYRSFPQAWSKISHMKLLK